MALSSAGMLLRQSPGAVVAAARIAGGSCFRSSWVQAQELPDTTSTAASGHSFASQALGLHALVGGSAAPVADWTMPTSPRCPEAHCPSARSQLAFILPESAPIAELIVPPDRSVPRIEPPSPTQQPQQQVPPEAGSGGAAEAPAPTSAGAPLECLRHGRKRRNFQGLEEKWWLEYDPKKGNFISAYGRGPHGGNSIHKADWPRQMVPIRYKHHWEKRERLRYAFRKNGFEYDIPKWGG
mmetsp:Transcript_73640/g.186207  ORF Transcript_73640/g.186207 Transcript_73640/m.186207 type:complete len:239 (+) Transcript_73640:63-779(+)